MDSDLHAAGRRSGTESGRLSSGATIDPCLLIPIYDHGSEIREVVSALASYALPCLIVDDGSHIETRRVLERIEREFEFVRVHRHARNRGKGIALKTGYRWARDLGFSHAIQLDADGQHDTTDVPGFVSVMAESPDALVLGAPRFDASVPKIRLAARQISRVAIWMATLSLDVEDPLCGFRGIPLSLALDRIDAVETGSRMDFEPELVVRLVWDGLRVVNIPTRVVYQPGGLSHFDYVRDNRRILGLYLRLLAGMLVRAPLLVGRRVPRLTAGWTSR